MGCPWTHAQLHRCIPTQRDHSYTEGRHHHAHGNVWHGITILHTAFELEAAVVAREKASEADKHLAQRRMHIKVELALQVVRPKFSKVGLVPDYDASTSNLVEAGPT